MNAQEYQRLAREHLQKHRPKMFKQMAATGGLQPFLKRLGESAAEMEEAMERQYLEKNPPPEDYQARVNHLAQAKQIAREIAMSEVVLVPDEESENAIRRGHY